MKQKIYNIITGIIFLVVAVLHIARIIYSWQFSIGGWIIPFWVSWVGLIVAGVLAYLGLSFSKQVNK